MCKLKSAIILKDRIFMPEYDSHSDMLNELGIKDDYLGASKKFVRAELLPTDDDVFSDIDRWVFKVDQDITPEWFSVEEYKPRMVDAVKEWAKTHIHIGINGLEIDGGRNHYIRDCKDVTIENSTVTAWGNSTVTAWENSTVTAWGNSTVTAWGNSTVTARENSTVTAWGNSTVTAWGNSTVTNDHFWVWRKQKSLILADNATFKDKIGKVIYQAGNYKLIAVESGKEVGETK